MNPDRPITKVLLADDDADDRSLFESAYLGRKDIVILPSAASGQEILRRLNDIPDDAGLPDLIVLDQNMAVLNGKQTLQILKSSPRFAGIRVCIYSTYVDTKLVEDCLRLGAEQVCSKPVSAAGYDEMMDTFLASSDPA